MALVSAPLLAFVLAWEGLRDKPYQDMGKSGTWTVCSGNTKDVVIGKTYTADECAALLTKDIEEHGYGALRCVQVPINRNQMVALVSFAFNVGVNAFCHSTLVRLLNDGDMQGAADQFHKWSYAEGKHVQGLLNRRNAERELFLKPDSRRGSGIFG